MEITTIETTYNTIPYGVASKLAKSNTKASKTITPKFDIGDWVYIVMKDFRVGNTGYFVMPTKIEWYKVFCIGKSPERHIGYRAKLYGAGKSYMFYERDIFDNKKDALLEVEKRNKGVK